MRRLLGVDLGERRIGLALADGPEARALPLATASRGRTLEEDLARLSEIVVRHEVGELVVGLPLDMSGGEGPQAARTRSWAKAVAAALRLPLTLRDERLTSEVAAERLGPMRRGRSGGPPTPTQRRTYRERLDREAATVILQDELDARTRR